MLSAEIAALRRIGPQPDFDGRRIAFAFGYIFDYTAPAGLDYNFDISLGHGELVCVIDVYSAVGYEPAEFDVDAWDAKKIVLRGAATRENYLGMTRAARAVLKGCRVTLPSGELIHAEELAQ